MRSQSDTNRKTLSALSKIVNRIYQALFTNSRKTTVNDSDRFLIKDSEDELAYKYVLVSELATKEWVTNNFVAQ